MAKKAAYPAKTKNQAVAALGRVATNGTPAQKAKVRAKVKAKFPGLPSSKGKGGSAAAAHNAKAGGKKGFPGAAAPFRKAG